MNAWSYEEMFAKADLVAIAKPISTQDTKERSRLSGPGDVVPTVGMVTEFDSRLILKGDKKTKHFILHHYRLAESNIAIVNGPSLVAFDSKEPASYLLFLVREPDGRYAPVGGQDDPGLFSVLKLGGMAD